MGVLHYLPTGRLLVGISVFWLALSVVFDGLKTLVLPHHLLSLTDDASKATTLGLITFAGIAAGMVVQPVAGAVSDRLRPRWGRRGTLSVGVLLLLAALVVFGASRGMVTALAGFVLVHLAASVAQAAQQGFIPDLVPARRRGMAAGLKNFMDIAGSLLGFVLLGQLLEGGGVTPALVATAAVILVAFALTVVLVREHSPSDEMLSALRFRPGAIPLREAFHLDVRRHRTFVWLVFARFLFLLGTFAVGQFFLFFVADRLELDPGKAAEEAGMLLASLTLITVLAAPPAGWAADRFGRRPLMLAGAVVSAAGTLLLVAAGSGAQILVFGGLMALGSAAFASANWAMTADVVPPAEAGRFFGLANIGTAGAAAGAGLLGPLVDWGNQSSPGAGYTVLFVVATAAFVASALTLWPIAAERTAREESALALQQRG